MKNKICLALDTKSRNEALALIDATKDYVGMYKVGLELYTAQGGKRLIEIITETYGCKVFLDLKFHDIPNTVKEAARAATAYGVSMFNVHTLGGVDMMRATADAVADEAFRLGIVKPTVLGVTVLTSISQDILQKDLLVDQPLPDYVRHLATKAKHSRLDGVVCSALEVQDIRANVGIDLICVTPGIRPKWSEANEQKRITTPVDAILAGSDYIVIGRPITAAPEPAKAAERILEELNQHFHNN